MTLRALRVLSLLAVLPCVACSNDEGPSGCRDFVATFKNKLVDECQLLTEREAEEGLFEGLMMEGVYSCNDVHHLRDKKSFYADCLPALEEYTCDEIFVGGLVLPVSCRDQLIHVERR